MPRSSSIRSVAAVAAFLLVLAGCADNGTDSASNNKPAAAATSFEIPTGELKDMTGQATVEIKAVDNSLEPQYVEITAGTQVVWKNEGHNEHDIVPGVDGEFAG